MEKKRSKQTLEVLYCNKYPEVLIDLYVMKESKLKAGIGAFWPPVIGSGAVLYFGGLENAREALAILVNILIFISHEHQRNARAVPYTISTIRVFFIIVIFYMYLTLFKEENNKILARVKDGYSRRCCSHDLLFHNLKFTCFHLFQL